MIDCNWLQSLEVGIDPAHTSFLHRFFEDEDPHNGYGKMFRDTSKDSDMPMTKIMREFPRPRIEVEPTDYGFRLITLREIGDEQTHVRVTNLIFPNAFVIPMSREMTITQWHVPVDDEKHYWYAIFTSVRRAGRQGRRCAASGSNSTSCRITSRARTRATITASIRTSRRTTTYTGMGADINVHDQWACESMGAIQDRTQEHLGTSDKAIIAYRRLLRAGARPSPAKAASP